MQKYNFQEVQANLGKIRTLKDTINREKTTLDAALKRLVDYDIPTDLDFLSKYQDPESYRDYIDEQKNKFLGTCTIIPKGEKMKIRQQYADIFDNTQNAVTTAASIFKREGYVFSTNKETGLPYLDEVATVEALLPSCNEYLDTEKLSRIAAAVEQITDSWSNFQKVLSDEKIPSPQSGSLYVINEFGGVGLISLPYIAEKLADGNSAVDGNLISFVTNLFRPYALKVEEKTPKK